MGRSLTSQRRERLALLLVASTGVTFTIAAVSDALAVRRARRRACGPPEPPEQPARRRVDRRTPVAC
ncbi:hypothetical protein ABZ137_00340 [Streptomyces bobili]|uniref:hypothetical protein n=1 Tax=Streptomyces bobili TaxID=67280 RepID=UPI0033AD22C4